jgi:hypothetical protein
MLVYYQLLIECFPFSRKHCLFFQTIEAKERIRLCLYEFYLHFHASKQGSESGLKLTHEHRWVLIDVVRNDSIARPW